jgi:hypothetical protein
MSPSLADHLNRARHERFVGRDGEISVFQSALVSYQVVSDWQAEGTHQGPIMNIPPTGRRVQVRGVSILEVKDGLIVRGQYIWDLAGMLRHMGLLPEL